MRGYQGSRGAGVVFQLLKTKTLGFSDGDFNKVREWIRHLEYVAGGRLWAPVAGAGAGGLANWCKTTGWDRRVYYSTTRARRRSRSRCTRRGDERGRERLSGGAVLPLRARTRQAEPRVGARRRLRRLLGHPARRGARLPRHVPRRWARCLRDDDRRGGEIRPGDDFSRRSSTSTAPTATSSTTKEVVGVSHRPSPVRGQKSISGIRHDLLGDQVFAGAKFGNPEHEHVNHWLTYREKRMDGTLDQLMRDLSVVLARAAIAIPGCVGTRRTHDGAARRDAVRGCTRRRARPAGPRVDHRCLPEAVSLLPAVLLQAPSTRTGSSEWQEQYTSSISKDCYGLLQGLQRSLQVRKAPSSRTQGGGAHPRGGGPAPRRDAGADGDAASAAALGARVLRLGHGLGRLGQELYPQTKARYEQEDYKRKSKDRYTPWDTFRHEMRFERRRRRVFSHMWKPYAYP